MASAPAMWLVDALSLCLTINVIRPERPPPPRWQKCKTPSGSSDILMDSPLAAKYGAVFARELQHVLGNGKSFYLNPEFSGRLTVDREQIDSALRGLLCPQSGMTQGRNCSLSYSKELVAPGDALQMQMPPRDFTRNWL